MKKKIFIRWFFAWRHFCWMLFVQWWGKSDIFQPHPDKGQIKTGYYQLTKRHCGARGGRTEKRPGHLVAFSALLFGYRRWRRL